MIVLHHLRPARRRRLPALALAAMLAAMAAGPAQAGMTLLDPGAAGSIDTGERSNYTAVTISNLGDQPGRLELGAPANSVIEIPPSGTVELNASYGRAAVQAINRGPTRLRILTRYQETFRAP